MHISNDIDLYQIIKINKFGDGAQTNRNGLLFEQTTSLKDAQIAAGYHVENHAVYKGEMQIGMSVPQKRLYTYFLNSRSINYKDYNSKEQHPSCDSRT